MLRFMTSWKGRQALHRFAHAPAHEAAREVGRDGRGLRHVQWMLRDSLREERHPDAVLERTRIVLSHLQHDRDLMSDALRYAHRLVHGDDAGLTGSGPFLRR